MVFSIPKLTPFHASHSFQYPRLYTFSALSVSCIQNCILFHHSRFVYRFSTLGFLYPQLHAVSPVTVFRIHNCILPCQQQFSAPAATYRFSSQFSAHILLYTVSSVTIFKIHNRTPHYLLRVSVSTLVYHFTGQFSVFRAVYRFSSHRFQPPLLSTLLSFAVRISVQKSRFPACILNITPPVTVFRIHNCICFTSQRSPRKASRTQNCAIIHQSRFSVSTTEYLLNSHNFQHTTL